jgi:hypothetical protein
MEKYVIIDFNLATNVVTSFLTAIDGYDSMSPDINNALTFDTRDEVRYALGVMLKDRPSKEFRYRGVTQALVLIP